MGTTQSASVAKLDKGDTTEVTRFLIQERSLISLSLCFSNTHFWFLGGLRFVKIFVRTYFTKMQFFEIGLIDYFSYVQGRSIIAFLAFHLPILALGSHKFGFNCILTV